MKETKLLLVSVFGPFGVKDKYAEANGMQMELLNNQITREQGIYSPRIRGITTDGLHLMAANISVPTVVLDLPSWEQFVEELKNGYTHVGIGFIVSNMLKAKRMAEYIRKHYPETKIILGGGGVSVPDIRSVVPCDEVCEGEGIRWLRQYFGEDPDAPISHCVSTCRQYLYVFGFRIKGYSASVYPGVGCSNACDYCYTSYKFGGTYIPFIHTGSEMFRQLQSEAAKYGVRSFTIEDENFLKHESLARELLAEMEKAKTPYTFFAFSSAETVQKLGMDFIVRLGIDFLWIGIETKKSKYQKNRHIDLKQIFKQAREHGIRTIGSSILFLDHHDKTSIWEDVDWAISLEPDLLQFSGLTPILCTKLHERMDAQNRILHDYPFEKRTGMGDIYFKHPHFQPHEAGNYINQAFRRNFHANGPGFINMAQTMILGYRKAVKDFQYRQRHGLIWNPDTLRYEKHPNPKPDEFMKLRIQVMRENTLEYRPFLLAAKCFVPNRGALDKCNKVIDLYNETFGKPRFIDWAKSLVILGFAMVEATRIRVRKLFGKGDIVRQPPTVRRQYHMDAASGKYKN